MANITVGGNGIYQSANKLIFNLVDDFGADPSFTLDSTNNIQTALTAASVSGAAIYAPPGRYKYTSLTIPRGGVSLIGAGPGATIFQAAPGSEALTSLTIGDGINTCADVRISGIQFTSTNQKTAGAAVKLQKCFRTWIDHVRFQNQYRGLYVYNSTQTWFEDADIRDTSENAVVYEATVGNGFDLYLNNIVADNPVVSNNGIGISWLGGENFVIQNCDFLHFVNGFTIAPPSSQQCRWGFFVNAEFDTSSDNNIKISSANGDIAGLTFVNCWAGTATNYGVLIDGGSGGLTQGIRFIGHKSIHNGLAGFRLAGGLDIHLSGCDVVSNSQTSANSRSGIEIASASMTCSIVGCRAFNGEGQGSTQSNGINFDANTYTSVLISGCDLRGNTNNAISLNGAVGGNLQIRGNQGYNPVGQVTAPGFPNTTVAVTNNTGSDVTAYIANGTAAITVVQIAGAGGSYVTTGYQIAASGWGVVRIPAEGSVKFTYASGTPTWTWFGD